MAKPRRVLFLQGPTSLFWRELALAFEAEGHATFKIHVHQGDFYWWLRLGGWHYRGPFAHWQAYLDRFVTRHGITDILYYADRQPYHVVAQDVAARHGINAIAVENGYLRPDWITLERGGMGVYSRFPDDPARILELAAGLPEPDMSVRYRHGFFTEMVNEVAYHVTAWLYRAIFPFYRSGRYYNTIAEYVTGILYLRGAEVRRVAAEATIATLLGSEQPFFVVALQLQADKQIQANSPFRHIADMIETVIASFAAHAPATDKLLIKQHPHDNGSEDWPAVIARSAARHGIGERTFFVAGGDLNALLERARGCIVVNSTVGLHGLRAACPTKTLGVAIFDMPGLTDQQPLDQFWREPAPVDCRLVDAFVRVLAASIQIKGSFYDPAGRRAAISEIVRRVAEDCVNGDADAGVPPRLERARSLGVPLRGDHRAPSCQPERVVCSQRNS